MGFNLMCVKCKPNLLFRSALFELTGMHFQFQFTECVLQLPSFMDVLKEEYQTLLILLAKVSDFPEPSVNKEFPVGESNVEFGENFRIKL